MRPSPVYLMDDGGQLSSVIHVGCNNTIRYNPRRGPNAKVRGTIQYGRIEQSFASEAPYKDSEWIFPLRDWSGI